MQKKTARRKWESVRLWLPVFLGASVAAIAMILLYGAANRENDPLPDRNVPGATTGAGKSSLQD